MVRANVDGSGVMARAKVMLEVDQRCCLKCAGDPGRVFQSADDAPVNNERAPLAAPGEDGDADPAMTA
jgi:hypothetical protein